MTRWKDDAGANDLLRRAWKTGWDKGREDALAGRRASTAPTYGYKEGYRDGLAETNGEKPVEAARIATIRLAGSVYTMNRALRSHWAENANLTRCVRQATRRLWMDQLAGRRLVPPVRVVVHQVLVEGRKPQDIGSCFPAVKAALDGLVDAGGLPDDSPEYVQELTFRQTGWKPDPPELMIMAAVSAKEGPGGRSEAAEEGSGNDNADSA